MRSLISALTAFLNPSWNASPRPPLRFFKKARSGLRDRHRRSAATHGLGQLTNHAKLACAEYPNSRAGDFASPFSAKTCALAAELPRYPRTPMAYVITDSCTKDELCVEACPVDCIHPKKDESGFEEAEHLSVEPDECIDCGACVPV